MRRVTLSVAALLAVALVAVVVCPAVVTAETIPVDLTLGYRWLDVSGNEDMYRSQINERSGFLVRAFTISGGDFDGSVNFVDHFRLDAADVGAGPASLVRLEVGRTGYYTLRATYRRHEIYSALPAFANPLLDQGSVTSQHTSDRTRNIFDAELELFPGKAVTPIVGYTVNSNDGTGATTYRLGENEFQLVQDLEEKDQEFRVGASFGFGPVSGSVVQGWRKFEGTENATLMPGKGNGNYEGTILELNDPADKITRTSVNDVNTPVTTAFLTGRFGPVKLSGGYVQTHGTADTVGSEASTGSFASYEIARFFKGLNETLSTGADAKYSRGNVRADVAVVSGFDVSFGYRRQKRQLEGVALINDLYLQTINYHGLDPKDVAVLLNSRNWLQRTDEVMDVSAHVSALGPFAIKVGYSGTNEDLTVTQDVAEVVIPGGQGGVFNRRVDRFDGALTFHLGGLDLGGEFRREQANEAVMRTDFIDRTTYRGRAAFAPVDWFRVSGQVEDIQFANDRTGIGLDGRTTSYGVDAELSLGKVLTLRAGGAQYKVDTSVPVRRPQDFVTETSIYTEDGDSFQGGLTLTLPAIVVEGSLSHYRNHGSWPVTIDRARVRAEFEFTKAVSLVGEWDHDEYNENGRTYGTLADYDANRYGFYVRFKQ